MSVVHKTFFRVNIDDMEQGDKVPSLTKSDFIEEHFGWMVVLTDDSRVYEWDGDQRRKISVVYDLSSQNRVKEMHIVSKNDPDVSIAHVVLKGPERGKFIMSDKEYASVLPDEPVEFVWYRRRASSQGGVNIPWHTRYYLLGWLGADPLTKESIQRILFFDAVERSFEIRDRR